MNVVFDNITKYFARQDDPEFVRALDRNYSRCTGALGQLQACQRYFVDATAANASVQLPLDAQNNDVLIVKIDASAHTVTALPSTGDTIATGATLTTQYQAVRFSYYAGIWYPIATS